MGEIIGLLISCCVILSFVIYMVVFFITAPEDAFSNKNGNEKHTIQNTKFEVTNIKDSILVTEITYVD